MTREYERTKPAVVKVETKNGERIANKRRATVRLEQLGETWFLTVKPWRSRRVYRMPLTIVAEMVCWKVAKAEADVDVKRQRVNRGLRSILGR